MPDLIEARLHKLGNLLPSGLSMPGDDGYVAATAIWAKPSGAMPRAVGHCRTVQDVQSAIRAVRDCNLPLSVRGGGHDWAGRALARIVDEEAAAVERTAAHVVPLDVRNLLCCNPGEASRKRARL